MKKFIRNIQLYSITSLRYQIDDADYCYSVVINPNAKLHKQQALMHALFSHKCS